MSKGSTSSSVSLAHGGVIACMGPVLDIQLTTGLLALERGVYSFLKSSSESGLAHSGSTSGYLSREVFFPSVYDCVIITRPSICFRDGLISTNSLIEFEAFLSEVPYNDAYSQAVSHLIPSEYNLNYIDGLVKEANMDSNLNMSPGVRSDSLLGLTALFILVRSYSNCLIAEISQQLYGGVVRCISLGPTEGLSTWKCGALLNLQPVVVPVGRVALGRIFNVTGSVVDAYEEIPLSRHFGEGCKPRHIDRLGAGTPEETPSIPGDQIMTFNGSFLESYKELVWKSVEPLCSLGSAKCVLAFLLVLGSNSSHTASVSEASEDSLWLLKDSAATPQASSLWLKAAAEAYDGNSGLFSNVKPIHATPVPLLKL
jgi:hypothetical protein